MQAVLIFCFKRVAEVNARMCLLNDWMEIKKTMSSCKTNCIGSKPVTCHLTVTRCATKPIF